MGLQIELAGDEVKFSGSLSTRLAAEYLGRQQLLEQEVEMARRRYEAALKRWNDLKY
jgi:DNA modification methylase